MGLYQSDWSKAPPHAHAYHVKTTREQGHYHLIEGFTQLKQTDQIPISIHITIQGSLHLKTAIFIGITESQDRMIPLADGTHYHEIEETTYLAYNEPIEIQYGGVVYDPGDDRRKTHRHTLKGKTREIVGNEPLGW